MYIVCVCVSNVLTECAIKEVSSRECLSSWRSEDEMSPPAGRGVVGDVPRGSGPRRIWRWFPSHHTVHLPPFIARFLASEVRSSPFGRRIHVDHRPR